MYIEDAIKKLHDREYIFSGRDRKFIRSIGTRVAKGMPLTTRQGWAVLNILRNHHLHRDLGMKKEAYDEMVTNPTWKTPLVPSVELKNEVRYLGDHFLGFRSSGSKHDVEMAALHAVYRNGMKVVCVENSIILNDIISFIGSHGFAMDEATERYLGDALSYKGHPSRVVVHEDQLIFDIPDENSFAEFVHHVLGADYL
jgi:hypothetical protein